MAPRDPAGPGEQAVEIVRQSEPFRELRAKAKIGPRRSAISSRRRVAARRERSRALGCRRLVPADVQRHGERGPRVSRRPRRAAVVRERDFQFRPADEQRGVEIIPSRGPQELRCSSATKYHAALRPRRLHLDFNRGRQTKRRRADRRSQCRVVPCERSAELDDGAAGACARSGAPARLGSASESGETRAESGRLGNRRPASPQRR